MHDKNFEIVGVNDEQWYDFHPTLAYNLPQFLKKQYRHISLKYLEWIYDGFIMMGS